MEAKTQQAKYQIKRTPRPSVFGLIRNGSFIASLVFDPDALLIDAEELLARIAAK